MERILCLPQENKQNAHSGHADFEGKAVSVQRFRIYVSKQKSHHKKHI
jgi:hypothetical protein